MAVCKSPISSAITNLPRSRSQHLRAAKSSSIAEKGEIVVFSDIAKNGDIYYRRFRQYSTYPSIWGIPRGALEGQRVQHKNSIKDNILKLSISCFKNLPRISGAIHDFVNETLYQFMSIPVIS